VSMMKNTLKLTGVSLLFLRQYEVFLLFVWSKLALLKQVFGILSDFVDSLLIFRQ
jgi:hypothetical protein